MELFYDEWSCSTMSVKDQSLSCKLTMLPLSSSRRMRSLSILTGPEKVLGTLMSVKSSTSGSGRNLLMPTSGIIPKTSLEVGP